MPTKKDSKAPIKKNTKAVKTPIKKEKAVTQEIIEAPVEKEEVSSHKIEEMQNVPANSKNGIVIVGIVLAAILVALLLFSQKQTIPGTSPLETPVSNSGVLDNIDTSSTAVDDGIVGAGEKIKVDYVGKLEDGTIFDSSIEEFAKKSSNYNPELQRKYEPLEFTVGAGQMIKGFDEGVVGMKLGEKKTLTIAPKDAYGDEAKKQEVPIEYLKDIITKELPLDTFKDVVTRTFPKEMLGEKANTIKVGEEISDEQISGKVTAITSTGITIEAKNTQNIFSGKKLEVGASVDYQGNIITIEKINDSMVTVKIDNKQNPFYGKKLVVGLTGKLPGGELIKIVEIKDDKVNVEIKHELAGKTLIFEVEIKEISK